MRRSLEGVFGQAPAQVTPAAAYANAIASVKAEILKQRGEVRIGECRIILDAAYNYIGSAERLRTSDPAWSYLYFSQAIGELREGTTCKYMTVTRTFPSRWMQQFRPRR